MPAGLSNAGGQRRPFGRPPGQAVLDHHHLDSFAAQLLAQRGILDGVQPDDVDQEQVLDARRGGLEVVGDQVFDEFAHDCLDPLATRDRQPFCGYAGRAGRRSRARLLVQLVRQAAIRTPGLIVALMLMPLM